MLNRRDFLKRMLGGIAGTVAVSCAGTAIVKNIVEASKPENRFDVIFKQIGRGEISVECGCLQMKRWKENCIKRDGNYKAVMLEYKQVNWSPYDRTKATPDQLLIDKGWRPCVDLLFAPDDRWDKIKHLA